MESSKMNNNVYTGGKIYKIVDIAYTEQYIGSTVIELSARIAKHRAKYRDYKKLKSHFIHHSPYLISTASRTVKSS